MKEKERNKVYTVTASVLIARNIQTKEKEIKIYKKN